MQDYSNFDDDTLQEMHENHVQNLQFLRIQEIDDGSGNVFPHMVNQTREIEESIVNIKAERVRRGGTPHINMLSQPHAYNGNKKGYVGILLKIAVSILVAVIVVGYIWWPWRSMNEVSNCSIQAREISLSESAIPIGSTAKLSINVENSSGKLLVFNWQAIHGTIAPVSRTVSSIATYTAPELAVDDTISVNISLYGCSSSIRKSKHIMIVQ